MHVRNARTVCGRPAIGGSEAVVIPMTGKSCETCLRVLEHAGKVATRWVRIRSWHAVKED